MDSLTKHLQNKKNIFLYDIDETHIWPYSVWAFLRLLTGGGPKRLPPKNLSHISYNDKTWYSYTLPKEDPENI